MVMQFILNFIRRLLKISLIAALGLVLIVAGLYLRLTYGPIDLSFLQGPIQNSLNKQTELFELQFTKPYMAWQGWQKPIEICAETIHIHHTGNKNVVADIPQLSATFRLRSLLWGQLVPSSLTFIKPVLIIKTHSDTNTEISTPSPQNILSKLLVPVNPSQDLKRFTLQDAHIIIDDKDGWGEWSLTHTTIIMERNKQGMQAHLEINLSAHEKFKVELLYSLLDNDAQIKIEVNNINPALMIKHIPAAIQQKYRTDFIAKIEGINIPISGKLEGTLQSVENIHKASFQFHGDQGTVQYAPYLHEAIAVKDMTVQGHYDDHKLAIDVCDINTADGKISAVTEGQWHQESKTIGFAAKVRVQDFSIAKLSSYWPMGLQQEARSWVVDNIQNGSVIEATLNTSGDINIGNQNIKLSELSGTIHVNDGVVRYLDGMPVIKGVQALARYTMQDFIINVTAGHCMQDLHIHKGQVNIRGMDSNSPHIEIDGDISGPVKTAYDLISQKPLQLTKDWGVELGIKKGQASTQLYMAFPLTEKLTWPMVKFHLSSKFDNLNSTQTFKSLPLTMTNGQGTLHVDDHQLRFTYKGLINGDESSFKGQHYFTPQQRLSSQALLTINLTSRGLQLWQPWIKDYVNGSALISLNYKMFNNQSAILTVDTDLVKTELNWLAWRKAVSSPGRLQAVLGFKKGTMVGIQSLHLQAQPGLDIRAEGTLDQTGKFLDTLTIKNFTLGKTQLQGSIKPHKHNDYRITITGDNLDLSYYIDNNIKQKSDNKTLDINFDLHAHIKQLHSADGKNFYNNHLSLTHRLQQIQSLSYVATVDTEGDKKIMLSLFPHPHGRRFVMKCDTLGEVFKAMGTFKNFHGGKLKLAATQRNKEQTYSHAPWEGKLLIEDFKLRKVPFLARILTLAFPSSFSDIFSKDRFLSFTELKTKFKATTEKLLMQDGRAYGPSMGFTINGSIQHDLRDLHIYGSIIPAYFLNTLISKIPFIGELITGGKHEGIIGVSYTVQGHRDAPIIQVNPASAFMPGFMRRLFTPSEADDVTFDEVDNPDDTAEGL